MDYSKPMNIVIIGGSNTGLMHGIVLQRLGHHIRILERNPSDIRHDLAAGITTHPEFEEFMKAHDRVDEPWSIKSPGVQFLDKEARVKRKMERPLQMTSWSVVYHRLRRNFDGLRSEFCGGEVVRKGDGDEGMGEGEGKAEFLTGMNVISLESIEDGVEIIYQDLKANNAEEKLQADMVILADGANSKLRATLFPDVKRDYAGYVAFRGTVPESEVSEEAKRTFDPNLTYFSYKGGYILLYIIPGPNGSLTPGHRRYNWVWYHPLPSDSPSFTQIMTDTTGTLHRTTLPSGLMNPAAWAPYLSLSQSCMTAPFAEIISKTSSPFITAINDSSVPRAIVPNFNNKVLITGEALNLMRPHMALSTSQSAMQALLLERVFRGEMGLGEWEKKVLRWGLLGKCKTNAFGLWNLWGVWRALPWVGRLIGVLVGVL
ncbi:hypothetical protein SBOR_9477 [Sclerotinia borealis F-4128]|uniref:2,6-dihydroxypyridine 3-monooxygenase substrate binding domain-containing protein n=1 Tax=Sclerotinia borealis (strain F-4128) TaxID=1432307 RepID=W9C5F3_SCLBF|nr:hypothetical protein SBOR_9477 [Sclerotinia borealis F-4128]